MKATTQLGVNKTGMDMSPLDKKSMLEAAATAPPAPLMEDGDITTVRARYVEEAEPIGTVPPPATLKGAAKTALKALQGKKVEVFVDKLAERLSFERTGSRLFEALIDKARAMGSYEGGPSVETLQQFHDEELAHFNMLRDVVKTLGADPTAMTPSADVVGVASMGLLQVVTDARTTLPQALQAMLIAELADNDGWELLIELAQAIGREDLADQFTVALDAEARHLEHVRIWMSNFIVGDADRDIETTP
jgi:tRNA isopentenyl-2-thiomethyl-A-37 hydroxylase MiaE